ncbi:hypothetical protein IF2G_02778 [Cordyceps javanica]|nr:hypothetical protein IF2G_02778 [Cordyceps javanica]
MSARGKPLWGKKPVWGKTGTTSGMRRRQLVTPMLASLEHAAKVRQDGWVNG